MAAAAVIGAGAIAYADNIYNDVDASIDATVEALPLTFPGGSSTVKMAVAPTNGDGKNGCNLTGSSTLVVNVTSSNASAATVSPSQVTFDSCGATRDVTVTPQGVGTARVSLTQVSNNTGGTFNLNPATFDVNVTAPATSDTTKPAISFMQTPDGNSAWWRTAPAKVTVTATDASGVSGLSCKLNGTAVAFDSDSTGSSTTTKYGDVSTSTDGDHTVECTAVDSSSNANSHTGSTSLKLDTGAPTVSPASYSETTWRNSPLSVSFTAEDLVSGLLNTADASFTLTASADSTRDSDNNVVPTVDSKTVEDVAGNSTTRSVSAWIDTVKPLLGITDTNVATSDVCAGSAPTKPTFSPSDALSGLNNAATSDSWVPATSASGVGSYTYTATATDNAANADTYGPKTYSVVYGSAYGGVGSPINSDGTSRFKLGSTVPVKFRLMCGSTPIDSAVAKLTVKQGDTYPDPGVDEAISTAASTTGNSFRYDSTGGQYIFNLSTKSGYTNPGATTATPFAQGTWTLGIHLDDGTSRTAKIQLVK